MNVNYVCQKITKKLKNSKEIPLKFRSEDVWKTEILQKKINKTLVNVSLNKKNTKK